LGEELRSELILVKEELSKLERENAHLREEIVKDKGSAAKQLARCEADADEVIQQLRRTVVQLEGQLKQQVGFYVHQP
jgi:signal transduction histidine kinase